MKIKIILITVFFTLAIISCKSIDSKEKPSVKDNKVESSITNNDDSNFPKPIGIINDYGQIFNEAERADLSKILYNYDIKTTRQIVVVTIDSIKPYTNIQKYATDLGQKWGVGNAEKDNGLVIVLCIPLNQIGIATGTGTELILSDVICKDVIDNTMIPEFRKRKYYDGIKNGVFELIKKWN